MFFFIVHLSISGDIISTAAAFERIALYLIIYWKDRQLNSKKQKEKESYGCLPANHLRPGTERAAAYNSCTSLSLSFSLCWTNIIHLAGSWPSGALYKTSRYCSSVEKGRLIHFPCSRRQCVLHEWPMSSSESASLFPAKRFPPFSLCCCFWC